MPAAMSTPAVELSTDESLLVKQTLQRYRVAYEGLDARKAQAVWPAVNQAALARDGGLEALMDRLLFRWGDQPLPLDLDGPLADELFTSISAMENAVDSLRVHCIDGITANAERSRDMVLNSLAIVTLLKPLLGYKLCAEIAREGYETGKSLHEIVVRERKLMTQARWDETFSFDNLINPKFEQ